MSDQPTPQPVDAVFGQAATYTTDNSDVEFGLAFSDDKKAFTASFGGDGLGLGISLDGTSSAPVVSLAFTFVLPLSNAAPGMEILFIVSGSRDCENGANGHLLFSVNDQSMLVDFPGELEVQDFVQQFNFKIGSASEVRVTVFLLADHDSTSDAGVNLNVLAIDANLAKQPN